VWDRVLQIVSHHIPVVVTLLLGSTFAFVLPAYSGPDEIGHVAYVAALAQGHLPTIPAGQVADIATGTTWQGQHPPLLYLLATPFYLIVGKNPFIGLYVLRLLGVASLALTVEMIRRLAALMLPPERVVTATWLVAVHPTIVYVSAMGNNEALAMTLSVACVWAAVNARKAANDDHRRARRWLLLTVVLGGLGLLTKLTAIAGVTAAAYAIGQDYTRRTSVARGLIVLIGAIGLWLPWGLYMQSVHGTFVPSPVQRPAFLEGFWALTLYPQAAATLILIAMAEFAIGLLIPYWLIAPYAFTYYPMIIGGLLISLWVLYTAVKHPELRFLSTGFIALCVLLVSQVLFRDVEAVLFLARYSPAAVALVSLMVAATYNPHQSRTRIGFTSLWITVVVAVDIYIFYFILFGSPTSAVWKR
jgi:4-amino-4-deoxy-L-arabinose transferase-like glycosyltransferase